jgi:hypothetical protein
MTFKSLKVTSISTPLAERASVPCASIVDGRQFALLSQPSMHRAQHNQGQEHADHMSMNVGQYDSASL